jgi:hypothetical protein
VVSGCPPAGGRTGPRQEPPSLPVDPRDEDEATRAAEGVGDRPRAQVPRAVEGEAAKMPEVPKAVARCRGRWLGRQGGLTTMAAPAASKDGAAASSK